MRFKLHLASAAVYFLLTGVLVHPVFAESKPVSPLGPSYKVQKVIDGNTIQLLNGERVRLIGVNVSTFDNQEHNQKSASDLKLEFENFKKMAGKSQGFLKKLVEKNEVFLVFDPADQSADHKDREGNILAYVYGKGKTEQYVAYSISLWTRTYEKLADKMNHLNVNATMIQAGYGFVNAKYPFKRKKDFDQLQEEAKKSKIGIWQ